MAIVNAWKSFFVKKDREGESRGFGTFFGVYLPGVLSMFGVIIYLRFGWIIGSLGLGPTIAVVTLSCFIVFVTVLSISSAATNMEVKAGGTYYMVSRALGIEIGSAIGIPLFIAQALAVSFCTVGFAESIHPFFPDVPITYLGITTLVLSMILASSSASLAIKAQFFIFLVIVGSLVSLFLGKPIPIENTSEVFNDKLSTSFWAGFALFFPATTGVESGVSMSGNLRSPRRSLPLGSIAVLLTGFIVYLSIPLFVWNQAPRSSLIADAFVFQNIARFKSLIIMGIWAATLSSVLGGLLAAPRTLQALALDGVMPGFLSKEWGKNKEPRSATFFCFIIAMFGVLYGSIDAIAPILTMFYLIAYATLNLATGLEGLLNNPSWRPTFRIHWTVSISGVVLCLLAMFMIDAGATFIALAFVIALYVFMRKRNLVKKWEDIRHGLLVFLSRFAIYRLSDNQVPPRSWRPNFLVLSSSPIQVEHLLNITSSISKNRGFLTLASVFPPNIVDKDRAERWKKMVGLHLKERKIEALIEFCMDDSLLSGAKKLLINYGMGVISPNTLVLGEMKRTEIGKEYLSVIQSACEAKKNIMIVRGNRTTLQFNKIHIWWDDSSRSNSELMLLLSYMLASNKPYKKSEIFLNSIVSSESGRVQRLAYFEDFFAKGRLSIHPNVYVIPREGSPWDAVAEVSKDADMVLMGMNSPKNNEDLEEFGKYYQKMVQDTCDIPNAVFVICSDHVDVSEIIN